MGKPDKDHELYVRTSFCAAGGGAGAGS
jgi:hypothetical protein